MPPHTTILSIFNLVAIVGLHPFSYRRLRQFLAEGMAPVFGVDFWAIRSAPLSFGLSSRLLAK